MTESIYELIKRHEGLRLKPYKCTAGKLTIGVGRNLDDNGISEEEAMMMLHADVHNCIDSLHAFSWFHTLNEVRQNALIDMVFNLGITRFKRFKKMIAALDAGDYGKAADEAQDSAWYNQVGSRAVEVCTMIRHGV